VSVRLLCTLCVSVRLLCTLCVSVRLLCTLIHVEFSVSVSGKVWYPAILWSRMSRISQLLPCKHRTCRERQCAALYSLRKHVAGTVHVCTHCLDTGTTVVLLEAAKTNVSYHVYRHAGCDAVQSGTSLPKSCSSLLPPSSGRASVLKKGTRAEAPSPEPYCVRHSKW
jgi:hypothetical protein